MSNDAEFTSLKLLEDLQAELRHALDGIGGRESNGAQQNYIVRTSGYINRAIEGYIYLRQSGRFDASRLLIRTALEGMIRVQAVRNKPELIFRIGFTEFSEDKKWARALNRADVAIVLKAIDDQWHEFERAYHTEYPEHPLIEQTLSLWQAAESAGIEAYYESHYRLYCRFTHAALGASTGHLRDFECEDNHTMASCALAAVDALASFGAPAPNLPTLMEQLSTGSPSEIPPTLPEP